MEAPNSIVIKKETNNNVTITGDGSVYTMLSESMLSKEIDSVIVQQKFIGSPATKFTVAAVEKVIRQDTTEVPISDVDTLFNELNLFFFINL